MNWRDAYLLQARDDDRVRRRLAADPAISMAHRLHYLQMVTEKLAKGLLASASPPSEGNHPPKTHVRFVRLLQVIKSRPDIRQILGFENRERFAAYINSLLPYAERVQRLAPSESGTAAPNPEYPWFDKEGGIVCVPAEHAFDLFDPKSPHMLKLEELVSALIQIT